MTKVLIGDMFASHAQALVNTVNCVGVMGKGVALEFKNRYPEMFKDYLQRCEAHTVKPGVPYLYSDLFGLKIVNFPTKDHWRSPSRLADVIRGLDTFVKQYQQWGITSVAFPPLGCGNGGLSWRQVGPLMFKSLYNLDIDIEIYAPYGTPPQELTQAFLLEGDNESAVSGVKGIIHGTIKQGWVALLEVLRLLEKQPYAAPVGRVTFQKICYTMTELGIDTGFQFRKGSYGPFAPEVREALTIIANANLIHEQTMGKMISLKTGEQYERYRKGHEDYLHAVQKRIDRTVDLFCRIKDTEQAEEVATVFYSVRELKKGKAEITELDVFNYILAWKKKWNTTEKRQAIAEAILNLSALRWIKVMFSEELIQEEAF